jgi:hypothetical protein
MFGRRRNKIDNAALASLPIERKTTINNAAPNYAWPILMAIVGLLMLFISAWWALVYLIDAIGSRDPEKDAATFVIVLMIIGIIGMLAYIIGTAILERTNQTKIELARITGEWEYKKALASRNTVASNRMMDEEVRFVRLLEAVMFQAYNYLEQNGQYTANDTKPWSREQAKLIILTGEREPVGWKMGSKVRNWLTQKNVIRSDNINLRHYPDFASFQEMLRMEYDMPVAINPPQSWEQSGYKFIED